MAEALALERPPRKGEKLPRGCGALVLGSEFCAGLLPSPAEAAACLAAFRGKLVLATPLLTDDGLSRVRALLHLWLRSGRGPEVIVNDLGLLEVLRSSFRGKFRLSCGRLLANRVKLMPEDFARRFLARYGFSSFEADDPAVLRRLKPYGLPVSWHYPFRYATVTRFCPWENRWACGCGRSCLGKTMPLKSPRVPKTLWLAGCAYFVKGQGPRAGAARNVFTPPPALTVALDDGRRSSGRLISRRGGGGTGRRP